MSRVACKIEVVVQHELLQDSKRTSPMVTRWSRYGRIPARQEDWAHTCVDKRAHSEKHAHADTHVETQMAHVHVYMLNFICIYTYTERKYVFVVKNVKKEIEHWRALI